MLLNIYNLTHQFISITNYCWLTPDTAKTAVKFDVKENLKGLKKINAATQEKRKTKIAGR